MTGAWGTADSGGAWTVAPSTDFSVSGGAGKIALDRGGATRTALLAATQRDSTDLRVDLSADKNAAGGTMFVYVDGRRVSDNTSYRSLLRFSGGKVSVALEALKGSTSATSLVSAVSAGAIPPGAVVHLRLEVSGSGPTTVRAKIWVDGAAEPSAWTVSTTDSYGPLQAPGAVAVSGYLSGSATNAPVVLSVLDLVAKPAG